MCNLVLVAFLLYISRSGLGPLEKKGSLLDNFGSPIRIVVEMVEHMMGVSYSNHGIYFI